MGACRRPVRVPLGGDATREKASRGRFSQDNLHVRSLRLDVFTRTVEGAASAISRDPVVKRLALKIIDNFGAGRRLVKLPVRLILELPAEEPSVLFAELLCLANHPSALVFLRGHDDLGAKHSHDLSALNAKGLSHCNDTLVAPLRAHHGHSDARVAARGLDHGVARLERAFLLGVLDDSQCKAVLHAAERIEELAFGIDSSARRRSLIANFDDRSVADGFRDIFKKLAISCATGLRGENRTSGILASKWGR
mmetsp:Transcript_31350/g.70435  ORF Transcript_31350/g.70435 Transcript_31350/m.70435 type:complete len:252 (+) Transcript_31350:570-1325(+)